MPVIALLAWYFFPVLMYNWFWYQNDIFHNYLSVTPVSIIDLKNPPQDWKNIFIGGLTIEIPVHEYTRVCSGETYFSFISNSGSFHVFIEKPNPQMLTYQDEFEVLNSTPADISFFNSRRKNMAAASNQVSKAIAIPNGGLRKILSVNTERLKALSMLSEKRDKGYHATTDLYIQNGEVSFRFIFNDYNEKIRLEEDLIAFFGGIKVPDQIKSLDQIRKDIEAIVKRYNKA